MLTGKLVRLRPLEHADAAALARWSRDYELWRLAGYWAAAGKTREACEAKIAEDAKADTDFSFAVETVDDSRLIGDVTLTFINWQSRSGFLGAQIGEPEYWGRGYGREAVALMLRLAFEDLNLNRVGMGTWEFNERARRCAEALGFCHEGRKRQVIYRDGRYWDEIIMSILASEYFARYGRDAAGADGGGRVGAGERAGGDGRA